jgi:L-amino acid N-acyltransferase YncA
VIRHATQADAPAVAAIYAPLVRDTIISFEEEPPSAEEMAERIATSHVWLVAEEDGEVVGYAYAARFHPRAAYRWSAEASVYLSPEARGRGIGTRLVTELLERLKAMGFVNVFGGTALPNPASERLLESFGFKKVAHWEHVGFKLGAWHDVSWRQLTLQEPTVPPPAQHAPLPPSGKSPSG